MDRRQALGLGGMVCGSLLWPKLVHASTARAVSLVDLVGRSTRIASATALETFARAEDVGDTRHIVSYTRLRVDDLFHGGPSEPEILVRTLGGRVGKVAELVSGEAELTLDESCVVFLQTNPEGIDQVTAMAQGHYPILRDTSGALRLRASRNMPHLVGDTAGAVTRLNGSRLADARALILGARR